MSRLDPKVHEANRKADHQASIYNENHRAVTQWLRENPHIGFLNGGKYYKIVNGKTVMVAEFGQ